MNEYVFPKESVLQAMQTSLPEETAQFGSKPPEVRFLYLPRAHARALQPDSMVVEGMRGAGKSLWWAALQSEPHRKVLARHLPQSQVTEQTVVSAGFGEGSKPASYPGKDTLQNLSTKFDPRIIWRTVVAWHTFGRQANMPESSWDDRARWVDTNPERVEAEFFKVDQELSRLGKKHLILFDALDRTADDWPSLRKLTRGLLQILLELRSFKAIRAKAFLRPDILEDPQVLAFPDASKITANKVTLTWPRAELYSLFWQYLGNANEGSEGFRQSCVEGFKQKWVIEDEVWIIPNEMRNDENLQRSIFHAIAGPWMGRDQRRGFPYTWLPNHLGDAHVQTSPRSFLAALRESAKDRLRSDYSYAIHYEAIKRGVQEASRIRVNEIKEDYPWVALVIEPLGGLVVPCTFDEIKNRWQQEHTVDKLNNQNEATEVRLPPSRLDKGEDGLISDLVSLGIFQVMQNSRINMPDVYRVGFQLKRRGGVKPVR
jgi:hypothetical protein